MAFFAEVVLQLHQLLSIDKLNDFKDLEVQNVQPFLEVIVAVQSLAYEFSGKRQSQKLFILLEDECLKVAYFTIYNLVLIHYG